MISSNTNRHIPALKKFILNLGLLLVFSNYSSIGQSLLNQDLFNPHLLDNTQWKYTYTTNSSQNNVIHLADSNYHFFLYFRFDQQLVLSMNGQIEQKNWSFNRLKKELRFDFRNIPVWTVRSFSEESLVLEFKSNNNLYCFHFIRAKRLKTPFALPGQELNVVDIHVPANSPEEFAEQFYITFLEERGIQYDPVKWKKRAAIQERKEMARVARLSKTKSGKKILLNENELEYIQIELVGGGYFGGVDPVFRNVILIKNDGRVIKEYQSELKGLQVIKHKIERDTLEKLVAFIEDQTFFEFDQIYGCSSLKCYNRLEKEPRPIAFRIAITKGTKRKIVTLPLWDGRGLKKSLIDYPPALDKIVQAIINVSTAPVKRS